MKDIERSLTHLTEAKELSHDKWWNLSQFLNKKQDNIYRETCAVLYQVLFKLAEEMVISDGSQCFEIALKISEEALTLARDSIQFKPLFLLTLATFINKNHFQLYMRKFWLMLFTNMEKLNLQLANSLRQFKVYRLL